MKLSSFSRALLLGLGALALGACSQGLKGAASGPAYAPVGGLPSLPVSGAYQEGQLIVGYRDEASLQAAAARAGATVALRVPALQAALLKLGTLSVGRALYAVRGQPGVAWAQPNYRRSLPRRSRRPLGPAVQAQAITVNPDPAKVPYLAQQWALKNTTPEGLNLLSAWDALKGAGLGIGSYTDAGAGKPIILASFAEPLPPTPDLAGQVVPALDFNAWLTCTLPNAPKLPDPKAQNLVDGTCTPPVLSLDAIRNIEPNVQPGVNYNTADNSGGEASLDASNMVANGTGILGAAYGAQVMPMVVFGGGDGSWGGDLAYAVEIIWAVQHGATVLNNSLGGSASTPVVTAAVNYALAQGALFVASSGDNGDTLVSSPANVPGVTAVTSTGAGGHLSNDSQVNPYVRFGAPGDNIVVSAALDFAKCDDATACPLGVAPVPGYAYSGGTSSSAPYTAGVLALVQGAYHQKFGSFPSPGAAEDLLYDTATPAPAGTQAYTAFRIPNAQAAVQRVLGLGAELPATRGSAVVTVLGGSGAPVSTADVFLQNDGHSYSATTGYSLGLVPTADPKDGTAVFLNIAPGTYQVLVGGPETLLNGDDPGTLNPADRLTATGSVTVEANGMAEVKVNLPKTSFAVRLTTTSPDLHLAIAEPGGNGFVVAGKGGATSGDFEPLAGGERYTLKGSYAPGPYLIGLSTADLQDGERAYAQLTVTENGKTSNVNLGPFTKGQTAPAVADGGVANIVQLSPSITALHK